MNSLTSNIVSFFVNRPHPTVPLTLPLDKSSFTLDTSGVAGVFGGDEAVSAMATVHVYENREWLGWYNSPGSYEIAKRYGRLAKSRFFDGFFPGVHTDPATLFDLDGWKGPKFRAAHSGTTIEETGHLAALFVKECASLEGKKVEGRTTQSVGVTVAELNHAPPPQMYPKRLSVYSPVFASIPIFVSVGACAACGVFQDWYAFSLILLGIVASGVSCLVLGSAKLLFTHPVPAKGVPAGDGVLGTDSSVVLLKGKEDAVNAITRGKFSLRFSSTTHLDLIQWCSHLFLVQCIMQLLLIPQASLFGQIMFLISLGVSALHNMRLSSVDIHRECLFEQVLENPRLSKHTFGTRTSAVVFTLLVLQPQDPKGLLDGLLPNDTKVWKQWKEMMLQYLPRPNDTEAQKQWKKTMLEQLPCPNDESFKESGEWFTQQEEDLSASLYKDAAVAYDGYKGYLQANPL